MGGTPTTVSASTTAISDGRRVISHGGESAGFLSTNNVYPELKSAIVVMTNTWSSGAYTQISRGLAEIVLPPVAPDTVATAQATRVRTVYGQLRSGALDRRLLTENANYYFSQTVTADFQSSLAALGRADFDRAPGKLLVCAEGS